MQIFIDESGAFVLPGASKWSVCCVSALVIPDEDYKAVCHQFDSLKSEWGLRGKEVKGKDLDEYAIASVIQMLNRYEVIFETVAIDMGLQGEDEIRCHKLEQAEKLTQNLTPAHKQPLVEMLKKLQSTLRQIPNQLYVQFAITNHLVAQVLQNSTLYFAQRKPQELGHFRWVVDAKDQAMTPYEDLWSKMVMPFLQSKFLSEPFVMLRQADYSAFEQFYREGDTAPQNLRDVVTDKPFMYVELNKIIKGNLEFRKSEEEPGIQLVDILCNAVRRAMNGNLMAHGWEFIGCLSVQPQKGKHAISLIDLTSKSSRTINPSEHPYVSVIHHVDLTTKPMVSRSLLERHGY